MKEEKTMINTEEIKEYIEIAGYKIHIYEVEYLERIKGLYGFIYITTNIINGKMYIGQRKINRQGWKNYLGSGKALQKAIKIYGKENFDRKIIDIAFNSNELDMLENFYSHKFNVVHDRAWYNLCYGGGTTSGFSHPQTEENKQKARERMLGDKNPMFGKTIPQDTIQKMLETKKKNNSFNKGKILSDEAKKKIREKLSGDKNPMYGVSVKDRMSPEKYEQWRKNIKTFGKGKDNPNYGKTLSNEQKRKMVDERKNHPDSLETREKKSASHRLEINQYDINGKYLNTYPSAKFYILHYTNYKSWVSISQCCMGKRKTAYGYIWRYTKDYEKEIDLTNKE